ncbi:uncharacterized protein LOC133714321 [Rosa rugosa]|uniref:uncharacterized protein LOC133714321 n=1 Tax=Rosa rugosa TaxID=74645 RepID=UPI002B408F43|nr:uncharacterized protein LOC133714321 [Rosa rugosa]
MDASREADESRLREVCESFLGPPTGMVEATSLDSKNLAWDPFVLGPLGFIPNFGRLGSWNVIMFLTFDQGPLAFYEGFIPNFGRLGSWNVIMFLTFDQNCKNKYQSIFSRQEERRRHLASADGFDLMGDEDINDSFDVDSADTEKKRGDEDEISASGN